MTAASHHALPTALLLDMDGTIVDSEPLWLAAEHEVMDRLAGPWTHEDQAACLGGPLETVIDYMRARATVPTTHDEVQELLLASMEERMRRAPLQWRPGARALIVESMSLGIPMALVTASWRRLVEAMHVGIAADLGFEPFAVIVAGDDVTESKPHPEPYLAAAHELGCVPSACLAIEDSPTGIRSAVMAGCAVIAVPHLAPVPADLDPTVVPTLEGLDMTTLWGLATRPR